MILGALLVRVRRVWLNIMLFAVSGVSSADQGLKAFAWGRTLLCRSAGLPFQVFRFLINMYSMQNTVSRDSGLPIRV